jgi:hypothetical protein
LSHPDVSGWIEKTNRYTSRPDRVGLAAGPEGFAAFAHQRIDHWMARTRDGSTDGYPAAVALLRAVYDMIDAVKTWEAAAGLDGSVRFQQACATLDAAYERQDDRATGMDQSCQQKYVPVTSAVLCAAPRQRR